MERLTEQIRRELRRFGPQAGMAELVSRWPATLGEDIARNAWPARIARDGTLHVATSSSAWAFELTNLQAMVLERLRAALGDDAPPRLAFAPGRVPETPHRVDETTIARPVAPAPADRVRAAELTVAAEDEELRSSMARAAAAALARAR